MLFCRELVLLKLEWMAKHRLFVEKIIKYGNAYAAMYNKQLSYHTDILFSAAQIQVIEYVLENENQKMIEIARRLGITRGAFSKNVKKLLDKGLLGKFQQPGNQKDIYLRVTPAGEAVYAQYSKYIYESCFKEMFEQAEQIPPHYTKLLTDMFDYFAERIILLEEEMKAADKAAGKLLKKD